MSVRLQTRSLSAKTIQPQKRRAMRCHVLPLFLIALVVVGCSLESPKSPRWTVDLTIPLADRHYDVPYIVEHADQPELIWDSISGARFEVVRTLDTIFVGTNISFEELRQSYADSLGLVSLRPTQTLTQQVQLTEVYSGPAGDIPTFAAQVQKEFQPFDDAQRAEITEGILRLEVTNNLGLDLDALEIAIEDVSTATEIGRAIFPDPIGVSEQDAVDLDLAGRVFNDRLRFIAYLYTPGGFLESTSGKSLEIAVYFPDSILVSAATAVVPPVNRVFADTIDFSNDIQASSAVFQAGQVDIEMTNGSNLGFGVVLTFPDLAREGNPVSLTGYLGPGAGESLTLDLQQIIYINPTSGDTPLRIQLELETSGSATPVAISAADRFTIEVDIHSPVIESVTGILPPTEQAIDGLQAEIDLPAGFEDIGFASGEIRLELVNSLPFPGEFALELTGERLQTLSITGDILPGTAEEPIISAINVANAASLLQPIPQTISVAGMVTYGDGITSGTARSIDFLVPSFSLVAPLSLFLDSVHYLGEVEGVKLSGEGDDLAGRLGAATIEVQFENLLPFGVTIEVRLADSRADLPDNPDVVLGPIEISPAMVDANGRTTQPVNSADVFSITAAQARVFEADSLFLTEEIRFFSSNGSVVTLRDSDYVNWRAILQIETTIGEQD